MRERCVIVLAKKRTGYLEIELLKLVWVVVVHPVVRTMC